ncbi:MAG: tetratricopeptide repeat protein, partial [Chitinivibrionales bacterium]
TNLSYMNLLKDFSELSVEAGVYTSNILDFKQLISVTQGITTELESALERDGVLDTLTKCIYSDLSLRFDSSGDEISGMLPQSVLERGEGRCLGIGFIMLIAAERAGLPLYGVTIPGHFFLRYENGDTVRNIEPNRFGMERSDSYYREQYSINGKGSEVFRKLRKREVAALLYYNAANHLYEEKRHNEAEVFYKKTLELSPGMAQASGNLALIYAEQAKYDKAREMFQKTCSINPYLKNIYLNYGRFEEALGNYNRAAEIYSQGLNRHPESPGLKESLSLLMADRTE